MSTTTTKRKGADAQPDAKDAVKKPKSASETAKGPLNTLSHAYADACQHRMLECSCHGQWWVHGRANRCELCDNVIADRKDVKRIPRLHGGFDGRYCSYECAGKANDALGGNSVGRHVALDQVKSDDAKLGRLSEPAATATTPPLTAEEASIIDRFLTSPRPTLRCRRLHLSRYTHFNHDRVS